MMIETKDWVSQEGGSASPSEVGLDEKLLMEADQVIRNKMKRVNSFLVIKDGHLVMERYYNGYTRDDFQHVMSVTKSVISALIGIAIDQGLIKDVNQRIMDFFPDFRGKGIDSLYQSLTLRHLLTMTSGIFWRPGPRGREPLTVRMFRQKDWVNYILNLPIQPDRIQSFEYNSMNSQLLSAILSRVTEMKAQEYANRYLFAPIGVQQIDDTPYEAKGQDSLLNFFPQGTRTRWLQNPQKQNTGGFGLFLRPIDMARLGWLFFNQGSWNGEQVISAEWVEASTTKQVPFKDGNNGYGYQWWIFNNRYQRYSALGWGGQSINVYPDFNMVVCFTCTTETGQSLWRDPIDLVEKYIIHPLVA